MIASFTEMLELQNLGQMATFTILFESCERILFISKNSKSPIINTLLTLFRMGLFVAVHKKKTWISKPCSKPSSMICRKKILNKYSVGKNLVVLLPIKVFINKIIINKMQNIIDLSFFFIEFRSSYWEVSRHINY